VIIINANSAIFQLYHGVEERKHLHYSTSNHYINICYIEQTVLINLA